MQNQGGEGRRAAKAFKHPVRDHIMRALWDGSELSPASFARTGRETVARALYHFRVLARMALIVTDDGEDDERAGYTINAAGRAAFAPTTA